jgi:hypothetical protein
MYSSVTQSLQQHQRVRKAQLQISQIKPVFLTYAKSRKLSTTVESFIRHVAIESDIRPAILVIDLDQDDYISAEVLEIASDWVCDYVCVHPYKYNTNGPDIGEKYYSVQDAAWVALRKTLHAVAEDASIQYVMWLEDDLQFSSQFVKFLEETEVPDNAGMVSLYLPNDGHASRKLTNLNLVDPTKFYGTQCVIFPKRALMLMLNKEVTIRSNIAPGYDIQWSRAMKDIGLKIYESKNSYVQHVGESLLHPEKEVHHSTCFVH